MILYQFFNEEDYIWSKEKPQLALRNDAHIYKTVTFSLYAVYDASTQAVYLSPT